jgi:hypothetical protein
MVSRKLVDRIRLCTVDCMHLVDDMALFQIFVFQDTFPDNS